MRLHFAHANGFPAASYRQLFEALAPDFDVLAIDKFGHDDQFPVKANWPHQVEELIRYLKKHGGGPVVGVGHSMGGVITFMAACEAPDLFSRVVLLDPPFIAGVARRMLRLFRGTPLVDKLTPAGKSKLRTREWSADQDMRQYFGSRALFKGFEPVAIDDYVNAATAVEGDKRYLTFDADIETEFFRQIPLNLNQYRGKLTVPGTLVSARQSPLAKPFLVKAFLKLNAGIEHMVIDADHLFPMEDPIGTAALLKMAILR